ncbi:MAG TPA: TerC family protein [Burkholderiales bacterium]|nr:TerC family protein [Burkholderiales bacterium]
MIESLTNPEIWVALFQICVINVLLSGDNAVVIALACRNLPRKQQKQAFAIGAIGVIVLMTALTAFAAYLMSLPYLEIIGSVLLLWIGIKLLAPGDEEQGDGKESAGFWDAVKTIIIADIVMSIDNVLGMAGAAKGHLGMLFIGMVITIPLILFGSALIMKLMERFPIFITFGAGLLGWVAGEMAIADPAFKDAIESHAHYMEFVAPMVGAAAVVIVGRALARRQAAAAAEKETAIELSRESAARANQEAA